MKGILIVAIVTITLALIFYTVGVWSEHKSKILKIRHLIFFWLGLCMDTTGTLLMGQLAKKSIFSGELSLHGVTGALAIILMIIHAVWAIWLVPYILGMVIGMKQKSFENFLKAFLYY